jgi:cytochrome c-type biogenesis protein
MEVGTPLAAFIAGLLTILSPCMLPMLPIVFATATAKHRAGPIALTAGLVLSFVGIGLFISLIGFSIGLDTERFRLAGAVLLILMGVVLLVPRLQTQLVAAAGPISNWTQRRFGPVEGTSWQGQFGLGLVLGLIWSPCVGPTLGAASLMASRGESLGSVILTMSIFGIGSAIPLVSLGLVSRAVLLRWRTRLLSIGMFGRMTLGIVLVLAGLFVATGLDRDFDRFWLQWAPPWLSELPIRY